MNLSSKKVVRDERVKKTHDYCGRIRDAENSEYKKGGRHSQRESQQERDIQSNRIIRGEQRGNLDRGHGKIIRERCVEKLLTEWGAHSGVSPPPAIFDG